VSGKFVVSLTRARELINSFVDAGGKIYVCSPCFKKRTLDADKLIAGAKIVGGAMPVEFMGKACASLSY
jgi:predicted peroxiredoxin